MMNLACRVFGGSGGSLGAATIPMQDSARGFTWVDITLQPLIIIYVCNHSLKKGSRQKGAYLKTGARLLFQFAFKINVTYNSFGS